MTSAAPAPAGAPVNHHGALKNKTMDKVSTMSCQEARNEAVTGMLVRWPWYGHFSMGLGVVETMQVPIAACGWDPKTGQGNLFFHPDNFPKFDLKTRIWAIVHEITHWINLHCHSSYRGPLVNIAMDMAVNSMLATLEPAPLLPTHPEEFITIDGVWHKYAALEPGLKRPPDAQAWEWYYNWLLDRKKNIQNKLQQLLKQLGLQQGDGGDGDLLAEGVAPGLGDQLTDHSQWDQFTEAEKELVKQYVNARAEQTSSTVRPPGQIAGALEGLVQACKPKVDWRRFLKNFVGMSGSLDVGTTRSRYNKYGGTPKVTLMPRSCILVAQDTSGSVPDEELSQFWGAIEDIKKTLGIDLWVMQVDYDVHSCEKFKEKPKGKGGYTVKGRGGTRMPAIYDYLNEHPEIKVDGVIVMTDGWTDFPTPKQMRGRRSLWVITAKEMVSKVPDHCGSRVWLDVKQKKVSG